MACFRGSFKCDAQFQCLVRFLTDATQTPNARVKVAALTYLKCLVDVMDCGDLLCAADTPVALAKVLAWTADHKSVEVRRAASAAFVAMFNCNMTDLTTLLQQLPQACQSAASQIIQSHLKRAASLDASPSSLPPRTPSSWGGTPPPVLQSPNASLPRPHRPHAHKLAPLDGDDTENLNPEEVSKSLKRTTDEIRNYSFDLDLSLEKHRDSTSQVSMRGTRGAVRGRGRGRGRRGSHTLSLCPSVRFRTPGSASCRRAAGTGRAWTRRTSGARRTRTASCRAGPPRCPPRRTGTCSRTRPRTASTRSPTTSFAPKVTTTLTAAAAAAASICVRRHDV